MKKQMSLAWLRKSTPVLFNGKISAQENYRYRQMLLSKVTNYWLKGVLDKSLASQEVIELGLEEHLDAVENPWGVTWETDSIPRQALPPGTKVIDCFDSIGEARSLLLLGETGAGKTTTLLQLTQELIQRAKLNINHPIPVVFNLSTWGFKEESIEDWLISQLQIEYQVPPAISKGWLETEQLLLVLDGLDEVNKEVPDSCLEALNEFIYDHGRTEIVISSRYQDYEQLGMRLRLQKAILLQPLSQKQIQEYLHQIDLEELSQVLLQDAILQELVITPLMLHIWRQAYAESNQVLPKTNNSSVTDSCHSLLKTYVERLLIRRRRYFPYAPKQVKKWLTQLAYRMQQESQTVFYIEDLQPSWLHRQLENGFSLPYQKDYRPTKAFKTYEGGVRVASGVFWATIASLFTSSLIGSTSPVLGSMVLVGVLAATWADVEPIKPVKSLKWSWKKIQSWLPVGLILGLSGYASGGWFWGLILGLGGTLISGIISATPEKTNFPNQGIWNSFRNTSILAGIGGALCLMGASGLTGVVGLSYLVSMPLFVAGGFTLVQGMDKGGNACLKHFVLRLVLYYSGYSPWNYSNFLDYAVERGLMQRVGGGYRFSNRLLQDYFISLGMGEQDLSTELLDASGYLERGNWLANLGDHESAIAHYTKAIALKSDYAQAYAGRSFSRYLRADYEGLLEDYHQTVELDPSLGRSLIYTATPDSALVATGNDLDNVDVVVLNHNSFEEVSYNFTSFQGSRYLLNDNSFEELTELLLQYIPSLNRDRASNLAHIIHHRGQAVVWSGKKELAALYRLQLSYAGLSLAVLEG